MGDTIIRWTNKVWGPFTGCTQISAGCDFCYAKTIAEKFRGTAFPVGFDPMVRPHKINEPRKWKEPVRVFVNSMSDCFHPAFIDARDEAGVLYLDRIFDVMLETPRHTYQILTKRPKRMRDYLLGTTGEFVGWSEHPERLPTLRSDGLLARRSLDKLPDWIWPGTTIENDLMTFRADVLREIPSDFRFISAEPLLEALPSLNLDGLAWLIVGGESGQHMTYASKVIAKMDNKPGRWMQDDWARDLRDRCLTHFPPVAFYFKQHSAARTEMGQELDGERWEQYPIMPREREQSLGQLVLQ